MSIIYRMTDRRTLKVDNIEITIGPLDYKIKSDMQAKILSGKPMDAAILALKNAIKSVKGLTYYDGSEYVLGIEDGQLTDESVNDLLNIPEAAKLNLIAITLINGIPEDGFLDPETREVLEGVKYIDKAPKGKKPRARQ